MNKLTDLDQAMEHVKDGMTILMGGFLGVGAPLRCIEKLVEKGVKDLTLVTMVSANPFAKGTFEMAPLFKNKQVKKYITAHIGTCPEAIQDYKNGDMEVEYFPMGTLIEKVRAGGTGLGGVLTPIGIGTLVEVGKEKLTINGKEYLLELPLRGDLAIIKGHRADRLGNIQYRGVAINTNPIFASAADYTIAEVDEIVDVGQIEPERVGTPSVFVNNVVQGYSLKEHQHLLSELWKTNGALRSC